MIAAGRRQGFWTPGLISTLRGHVSAGLSDLQIAEAMGLRAAQISGARHRYVSGR